jgi:hypothetical protein
MRRTPLVLGALAVLLVGAPARSADFKLIPQGSYLTGVGSYDVKVADLNADGRPDIVCAIADEMNVSVFLNDGTGHFATLQHYPGGTAVAVDIADYTGDGKPDIVVANYYEGTIALLKSAGAGTFEPQVTYAMGTQPRDVVGGDFDGDGLRDIAAATGSGSLWVRKGLGAAGFGAAKQVFISGTFKGIDAGDYDHDGKVDLVLVNYTARRAIPMHNDGNLDFSPRPTVVVGVGASDIAVRDLDGDGWVDLAVANEDGTVSVARNLQNGGFGPRTSYPIGGFAQSIAVDDFNGDGKPDLLCSTYSDNMVTVLLGQGGGVFSDFVYGQASGGLRGAAAGDFDGDTRVDVVAAAFNGGAVHVLRNVTVQTPGPLSLVPAGTYVTGIGSYDVKTADLDQDGDPEILAAIYDAGRIVVLENGGNGQFPVTTYYPTGRVCALDVADYDGDGKLDVAATNFNNGQFSVRLGQAAGALGPERLYELGNVEPRDLVSADLDGDGVLDLAIANSTSSVFVTRGQGDGTFSAAAGGSFLPAGLIPKGIAAGDFDGDGKADLAVADHGLKKLLLFRNLGGMAFAAWTQLTCGVGTSDVVAADLDGDGDVDLAEVNEDGTLLYFLNDGHGAFGGSHLLTIGALAQSIAAADFNGDGRLDLLASSYAQSTVTIFVNGGNGFFTQFVQGPSGEGVRSAAAGDFNVDGKPDVVTGDFNGGTVHVLFNDAAGPAPVECAGPDLATPPAPSQGIVLDLDGDGRIDVATSSESGTLSYRLADGAGGFAPRVDLPLAGPAASVAGGDLTGDGKPELVAALPSQNAVAVLRNVGGGLFQPLATLPVGTGPRHVTLADLDMDGRLDIATVNDPGSGPGSVTVLFNSPDADWNPQPEPVEPGEALEPAPTPQQAGEPPHPPDPLRVDLAVGPQPTMLATGDFNQDGSTDLVVANDDDDLVIAFFGAGEGRFLASSPTAIRGRWLAVADMNGDGRPDVVAADPARSLLRIAWSATNDPLRASTSVLVESEPRSVALQDLNGDAFRDIVYASSNGVLGTRLSHGSEAGVPREEDFGPGPACFTGPSGRSIVVAPHPGGGTDAFVAVHDDGVLSLRTFPSGGFLRKENGIASSAAQVAWAFGLDRPAPNPATGGSAIRFTLARAEKARLEVYDVRGRLVRRLLDGVQPAGPHEAAWDGTDGGGARVRPGVYFYRLTAGTAVRVERQVLLGAAGR